MKILKMMAVASVLLVAQDAAAQKKALREAKSLYDSRNYLQARDVINQVVVNDETKDNAEAWLVRGNIYNAISRNPELKKSEPKAGSLAMESFNKAIDIDKAKYRFIPEIQDTLEVLAINSYNTGNNAFFKNDYATAQEYLTMFDMAYAAMDKRAVKIDQTLMQIKQKREDVQLRLAIAADSTKDYAAAKKYYGELVNKGYDNSIPYEGLAQILNKEGKFQESIQAYDKGIASIKTEENRKTLMIAKLNFLLENKKTKEAIEMGKQAIAAEPTRLDLYVVQAQLYESEKMPKEAGEMYAKMVQLEPESFKANYYAGTGIFNRGVTIYESSLNKKGAEAKKLDADAKALWKESSIYLEKAASVHKPGVDGADQLREAYRALMQIYAQLGDDAKSLMYKGKMDALKK